MAIGDAYATPAEYRALHTKTTTDDDHMLELGLEAVSRLIDRQLDRRSGFNRDVSPTVRVYMPKSNGRPSRSDWAESENPWRYGGASRVLDIEDLVELDSSGTIKIDENNDGTFSRTLVEADYEFLPRNAATGPESEPYRQIGLLSSGSVHSWTPGLRVQVTAIHGWPAVPKAIKLATLEILAMPRVESVFATGRISEFDSAVDASPQARKVINDLKAVYHGGVYF